MFLNPEAIMGCHVNMKWMVMSAIGSLNYLDDNLNCMVISRYSRD